MTQHVLTLVQRFEVLIAIAVHPGITRAAVAVAAALLTFYNGKTGSCYPAVSTIAKRAGITERSAQRGIGALIKAGFLTVVNRDGGVRGETASYIFRGDNPVTRTGARSVTRTGDTGGGAGVPPLSPKLGKENPGVEQPASHSESDISDRDIRRILRKHRARLRSGGDDITNEWLGLVEAYGMPLIIDALQQLGPGERWPSHVENFMHSTRPPENQSATSCTPWDTDPQLRAAASIIQEIGWQAASLAINLPVTTDADLHAILTGDPSLAARLIATTNKVPTP